MRGCLAKEIAVSAVAVGAGTGASASVRRAVRIGFSACAGFSVSIQQDVRPNRYIRWSFGPESIFKNVMQVAVAALIQLQMGWEGGG